MEEEVKEVNKELKKSSKKLVVVLFEFIMNVLITGGFLWLAANLICFAFKIEFHLTYLQAISIIFALAVLFGIGGGKSK